MLLLGHIVISLGSALIINRLIKPYQHDSYLQKQEMAVISHVNNTREKHEKIPALGLFDIICITIGSILPDIIDKPVGHYLFSDLFGNNGRIFSHTLLFACIILMTGLFLYYSKKRLWPIAISFGVFMHLVLDSMWRYPRTLFWPFFGLDFPRSSAEGPWLLRMIYKLLSSPSAYLTEILGLIILVIFFVAIIQSKRFAAVLNIRR